MKKLLLSLFLVSIMLLSACAEEPAVPTLPENPDGTLPSFPEEKTPLEILTDAARKTKDDASVEIVFGRVSDGREEILESCGDFITNGSFLEDFCAFALTASPSNTGTVRYQISGLTRDQLYSLLHGEGTGGDTSLYGGFAREDCSVAIEVDADGYLTLIEYTVNQYRAETLTGSDVTYVRLSHGEGE